MSGTTTGGSGGPHIVVRHGSTARSIPAADMVDAANAIAATHPESAKAIKDVCMDVDAPPAPAVPNPPAGQDGPFGNDEPKALKTPSEPSEDE